MNYTPTANLKVVFTPEEVAEFAQQLARKMGDIDQLELEKKAQATAMKERIETEQALAQKFARLVRDKYDFRDVEIEWLMHVPVNGKKTARRLDTGSITDIVEKMSDADMQAQLPFDEPRRKK